jgi:hypothetical protein
VADNSELKEESRLLRDRVGGGRKTDAPKHIPAQFWEAGIYENEYSKRDGTWRIQVFNLRPAPATWPETLVMPFHYAHPVTGKR